MIDTLSIASLLIALAGALAARAFLHAALVRAAALWPDWAAELEAGSGRGLRLGMEKTSGVARRRMIAALLTGKMPEGPAGDAGLRAIAARLKLSLAAIPLGVAAVVVLAQMKG